MARILLVEDDLDVRMLLEHVLIAEGYEVTAVETATSARTLLDVLRFDLVVADGILIDGDGTEIAQKAIERRTKALIITGDALHLPTERLRMFDYLLKPLSPQEFVKAVRLCLGGRDGAPA
jgi:sigma-B regulation protein RsbU (phosphoserine phosphatase)